MWGLYEKLSLWRPRNRQDETGCRTFWQVENETEKEGGRQMTIAEVSKSARFHLTHSGIMNASA